MKNKKALYLLLGANAISHLAQGISMLSIPWYFAKHLDAASTFAVIYSVTTFLTLFWGLYAGTLIDRYPRKNIFITICAVSAILLLSVSASGYINGETHQYLVALVFCFTIFNYNIHYPTLYAFGQEITEPQYYSKTNSLLEIMGQSTNVLSGAIAILLLEGVNVELGGLSIQIDAWPIHKIFLTDGITYIIAMFLISRIKYHSDFERLKSKEPIMHRLKEGFRYLKEHPLIFYFGNASFTVFIFVLIATHLIWPIYIEDYLEAPGSVYAITKICYSIGALLAGIVIAQLFRKKGSLFGIVVLMIVAAIAFSSMSITKNVYLLFFLAIGIGISNAGIRILRITYLFNHIPNTIIGRTNSVFQSINIFLRAILIGAFSWEFFSRDGNIVYTLYVAVACIIISLLPLLWHYKSMLVKRDL